MSTLEKRVKEIKDKVSAAQLKRSEGIVLRIIVIGGKSPGDWILENSTTGERCSFRELPKEPDPSQPPVSTLPFQNALRELSNDDFEKLASWFEEQREASQ